VIFIKNNHSVLIAVFETRSEMKVCPGIHYGGICTGTSLWGGVMAIDYSVDDTGYYYY
jgi:hypothetical protein